ncbi:hypothetical protein [Microbulbifer epialgicus]|uniref:Uncharacterized protein n=1 Tax=Microbulbifer epialgicus TaxID=393907 RepID=A0ABV4NYB2_9GAMM
MSGVLQRLVGRATGDVSAGLRPRLPSRFETNGREYSFREIHTEENTQPSPSPVKESKTKIDSYAGSSTSAAIKSSPAQVIQPVEISIDAPSPIARPSMTGEKRAGKPLPVTPSPLLTETHASTMSSEMNASIPEDVSHQESRAPIQESGMEVLPHSPSYRPNLAPDRLPEPLLPQSPTSNFIEQLETTATAPPLKTPAASEETETDVVAPPEINIHIGRLDIRSEMQKTPPSKHRASQARSLPSLSDYLRGRKP